MLWDSLHIQHILTQRLYSHILCVVMSAAFINTKCDYIWSLEYVGPVRVQVTTKTWKFGGFWLSFNLVSMNYLISTKPPSYY